MEKKTFAVHSSISDIQMQHNESTPFGNCENQECSAVCKEAYKISKILGLDNEKLIQKVIELYITPKYGCKKDNSKNTTQCKFGYTKSLRKIEFVDTTIIAKMYVAEQSKTTCDECKKHDKEIFIWPDEQASMPKLPIHPNCKCRYLDIAEPSILAGIIRPELKKYRDNIKEAKFKVKQIIEDLSKQYELFMKEELPVYKDASADIAKKILANKIDNAAESMNVYLEELAIMRKIIKGYFAIKKFFMPWEKALVVIAIDKLDSELAKVPPVLKKIHYDRLNLALQQLFNLPKNPKEARSPEFVKAGWVKATENQNRYHKNKGQINNVKYHNTKTGQEVVFEHDGDNAKIVLDKSNIGTFNYSSSLDFWHLVFDMIPYYIWANSPDDTTKTSERIIGN